MVKAETCLRWTGESSKFVLDSIQSGKRMVGEIFPQDHAIFEPGANWADVK